MVAQSQLIFLFYYNSQVIPTAINKSFNMFHISSSPAGGSIQPKQKTLLRLSAHALHFKMSAPWNTGLKEK